MSQLRDNLVAARAMINTPAKWRKDDSDRHSDCCAVVATDRIARATRNYYSATLMTNALYDQIPAAYRTDSDEPGVCVGDYNDAPATTHSDIMALFDRAIEAAK